jgi:signal transduction histidine kinase
MSPIPCNGQDALALALTGHELKTALTPLKGYLQLALSQMPEQTPPGVPGELGRFLVLALQQTDLLQRLLDDLLDDAFVQQRGGLALVLAPCDLVALAHQAAAGLSVEGQALRIQVEQAPLCVMADGQRIQQVIANYLSNALKYAGGHSLVTVGVALEEGRARVWVRDGGPGISICEQARIWERFYRAETRARGLGLGLSLCRSIIEQHGGEVGVDSSPGRGATFWFALPVLTQ